VHKGWFEIPIRLHHARENNTPTLVFLGHYDDQFIRENSVWKFLRREAPADIPAR
jgi:hypothetical protein